MQGQKVYSIKTHQINTDIHSQVSSDQNYRIHNQTPSRFSKVKTVRGHHECAKKFDFQNTHRTVSSFNGDIVTPLKSIASKAKSTSVFKKTSNIMAHYSFGKVLGEGSFGKVLRATCRRTNVQYAAKIMKRASQHESARYQLIKNEIEILSQIRHPQILRIHELLRDDDNYYIVSEYLRGGQLFEYMQTRFEQQQEEEDMLASDKEIDTSQSSYLGRLDEEEARSIAIQLLQALQFLHTKNIVHRDVKPENILLKSHKTDSIDVKLIDFGFAAYCQLQEPQKKQQGASKATPKLTEILGSPLYMAPEIVSKQSYDHKVDVWSAGVVIFSILSGRLPFFGNQKEEVYRAICEDNIEFAGEQWQGISKEAKDFLKMALSKDPKQRPSSTQILEHPWLRKGVSKI